MQIYESFVPPVLCGESVTIEVEQTLHRGDDDLIRTTGPKSITFTVDGPHAELEPAEIAGVYPAPGSTDSPDEFLPHIALTRRTLPWERKGPPGAGTWLALVVLSEGEMNPPAAAKASVGIVRRMQVSELQAIDTPLHARLLAKGLAPTDPVGTVRIPNCFLPDSSELGLLCHVKRAPGPKGTAVDHAIVIANRLSNAGDETGTALLHHAFLVSLEGRDELDPLKPGSSVLPVLHHWSFTPSREGDFQAVMNKIRYRPNGGVLRFGNLPRSPRSGVTGLLAPAFAAALDGDGYLTAPLAHAQTGAVTWRGPLRPFAPGQRSKGLAIRAAADELEDDESGPTLDYSHASAFELGRLLALGDPGIQEDLRSVRVELDNDEDLVATTIIPPALRRPDPVINPVDSLVSRWDWAGSNPGDAARQAARASVTGIDAAQATAFENAVAAEVSKAAVAADGPISAIDVGAITVDELGVFFAEASNAVASG